MPDSRTADASATRAFFVNMLVRDISVNAAILDLIDNAVDAAYEHEGPGTGIRGCHAEVELSPEGFMISDNCGGIALETARQYAFRFGRAAEFNPESRIGEFGIGMKRAVFRLGREFNVDSSTADTRFIVDVNVDEWREEEGDWTFPMDIDRRPTQHAGTIIAVRNLHEGVKELFSEPSYARSLLHEIAERHSEAIRAGFQISLNHEPVDLRIHELLVGQGVTAGRQRDTLHSGGHSVELDIIAGVGPDRRPVSESGWNVYCNGRLVLKADRTAQTGWDFGNVRGGDGTPAWHPQYARFRGFVFFRSALPGALPWTTTKTEIDESSEFYRNALGRMRSIIRRFADFTNDLDSERERYEESNGEALRPIQSALDRAKSTWVSDIPIGKFEVPDQDPDLEEPIGPATTNIQYRAEVSRVNELKDALGLRTNRAVGEFAFERLYEREIS